LKRVALIIQYDGTNFSGWQRQKKVITVQETLENKLKELSSENIKTFAAGRTDAGVHAAGQVLHFDTDSLIPPNRWADALNGRLPESIRILESVSAPNDWHACFSAIYRHYRYIINNGNVRNIFFNRWTWHKYQVKLDENLMNLALQGLQGQHDFFAFQKTGSKRATSITTIKDIKLSRIGDLISLDIKATGFLYGMVRSIVGQLVLVGEKKITPDTFYERWSNKKKEYILQSAPAKGLCFINAVYKNNLFNKFKKNDLLPKFLISGFS
tara:strand:+ start:2353 stop:3159 length:807 start_codon:yes stop_codon:yes gene_type:complete